jgi:hypothetical protein
MIDELAFQDQPYSRHNHCWVCGNDNPHGLYIKSKWDGDESVCEWKPKEFHTAGWPLVLNGGIISGIIDCHCLCTVIAEYYKEKTPEEKESPKYWFATGSIKVDFLKPTPVDKPVQLRAKIIEMHEKKALVKCSLYSENIECARGEVLAVRVPAGAGPMM